MEGMFKIQQVNVISDELVEIDIRRDNAFNGILAMVNAFAYCTDSQP
jgi:hypothetical protein